MSPIFLQFFECIAHLFEAHQSFFEYTPCLLSFVLYHSYSGSYPTFRGNSDRERSHEEAGGQHMSSLWSEVFGAKSRWLNPRYDPTLLTQAIVHCQIPFHKLHF